jgi:hypothetical protein
VISSRRAGRGAALVASALSLLLGMALVAPPATAAGQQSKSQKHEAYDDDEVLKAAEKFFDTGAAGLGDVLGKVLKEKGKPIAFIRGEEVGGAIGVGVRYGNGELVYKGGGGTKVYWQGPSVGFDLGANAVKVFVLVYDLPDTASLFQRYPGVEGSLYFVGGFGANYVQNDRTVLAPVRFGVGWRQGIGIGYMHFTRKKRLNPF